MLRKEKRISTILGLLIVFLSIGGTAFLVEHFEGLRTGAQPSIIPQEMKITNLATNGLTISWVTGEKTTGFIAFGEEELLRETAHDERDQEEKLDKYFTHHISLKNLKPDTTYYFKIISEGKTFDQAGFPYEVRTAPVLLLPSSSPEPTYGTVLNPDNTPVQGAIVYLSFEGALPLSTLTKPSGNFLLPINLALRSDLKAPFIPDETHDEKIIIRATADQIATVVTNINNDSPIPTIILGKSYDFRSQKKETQMVAEKKLPQKVLGAAEGVRQVEIIFPIEDAKLLDPKPVFKGKGVPRNEVIIKIESPILIEKTVVDPNGQWFFRPDKPLPPGKHKITITTKNERGEEESLTRNFLVLKSGSQVLGEATPSATLTPTTIPTTTPAFTPTPTLTLTPTRPPPTPTPSLTPGFSFPTTGFLLLGAFLFLTGTGLILVF